MRFWAWKSSFSRSSTRTFTDSKEIPAFAKWHEGQEGEPGHGSGQVRSWSQVSFSLIQQWGVVKHESETKGIRGVGKREGRQDQGGVKLKLSLSCGASSTFPGSCPCWGIKKSFLDCGRVFPCLTSTSEKGCPFQLGVKAASFQGKLLHPQL